MLMLMLMFLCFCLCLCSYAYVYAYLECLSRVRDKARQISGFVPLMFCLYAHACACAQASHELMQIIFGLQLAGFKCLTALSVSSVTWMSLIFITLRSYRMEICPTDVKYSVVKAHQKTVPRTGNFSSRYPHSWTRCECLFALFLCDKASFSKTKASRIFLHELSARCTPLANKRVLVRTGSLWEQLKTQRSNNVHKETKGNKKTSV